jgi:quercetin dioxygenase-like cupin family protein
VLIRKAQDVEARPMSMPGASGVSMRLLVSRDDGAPTFSMRMFEVEPGGHTPLHQHNYEHEVIILAGEGQLVTSDSDDSRPVAAGDAVYVPANELHRFRNSGAEKLQFVCMVPTHFDCGGEPQPTPGS